MSIHQTIYNTLGLSPVDVAELIGAGDVIGVAQRQEKMKMFLEDHKWDEQNYKEWLRSSAALPSLFQQGVNLIGASYEHVAHKMVSVSDDVFSTRINACDNCEYLYSADRCTLCGCYMKVKARWGEQRCPIGKW